MWKYKKHIRTYACGHNYKCVASAARDDVRNENKTINIYVCVCVFFSHPVTRACRANTNNSRSATTHMKIHVQRKAKECVYLACFFFSWCLCLCLVRCRCCRRCSSVSVAWFIISNIYSLRIKCNENITYKCWCGMPAVHVYKTHVVCIIFPLSLSRSNDMFS